MDEIPGMSERLGMDTIFGFNVAFAALAAGIVSRFTNKGLVVTGAIAVAWLAMTVRTVWIEGPREQTFGGSDRGSSSSARAPRSRSRSRRSTSSASRLPPGRASAP